MKKFSVALVVIQIVIIFLFIWQYRNQSLINSVISTKTFITLPNYIDNQKNSIVMVTTELDSIIAKNQLEQKDEIIKIFESERNNLINIITIISILLAVLGVFPMVTGFIEKQDYTKIKSEMRQQIQELIQNNNSTEVLLHINDLQNTARAMSEDYRLYLPNNTLVENKQDFAKYIIFKLEKEFIPIVKIAEKQIVEIDKICIVLMNFIICSTNYGIFKKYMKAVKYNNNGFVFKTINDYLDCNVNKALLNIIKNTIYSLDGDIFKKNA